MKIKFKAFSCYITGIVFCLQFSHVLGQSIHLIPNPEGKSIDSNPVFIFDNKLYSGFYGSGHHYLAGFDGESFNLINNIDTSDKGPFLVSTTFHDSIFCSYVAPSNRKYLARTDGGSYTVIPNPDTTLQGCHGYFIALNDTLYFNYLNSQFKFQLARYINNSVSLIANPDTGVGIILRGTLFNDQLYYLYRDYLITDHLAKYEDGRLHVYPNPDNGQGCRGKRITYNNKLYISYTNARNQSQLAVLKNDSVILLDDLNFETREISDSSFIIYKDDLYMTYSESERIGKLARFNGDSVERINNPIEDGEMDMRFYTKPIIFKDKLYLPYYNSDIGTCLVTYDGATFSFINNIQNDCDILTCPIILGDFLYYRYRDTTNTDYLAVCDGFSLIKIPNPDSGCIEPVNGCGYNGEPYVYHGELYIKYKNNQGILQLGRLEMKKQEEPLHFKIYPNPSEGHFTLETYDFESAPEVEIFDICGHVVLKARKTGILSNIDAGTLKCGIYLVRITNERGSLTEKLIIL